MEIVNQGKSKKIIKMDEDKNFMTFIPHLRSITSKREGQIIGTEHERLVASLHIMKLLEKNGIKTQLAGQDIVTVDGLEGMIVKPITTIPIEFIARYYAAGSICRLYPTIVKPGQKFLKPLYKFDLKQDLSVCGVDDPTLNESYITGLGLLTEEQLKECKSVLAKTAEVLNRELDLRGIRLIDFKMELGFDKDNNIVVIDEISQDGMRAVDKITNKSVTKDVYRELKSDEEVLNAYKKFNDIMKKEVSPLERLEYAIKKSEKKLTIGLFTHKGTDLDGYSSIKVLGEYLKLKYDGKVEVVYYHDYNEENNKDIGIDYCVVCDVNEMSRICSYEQFKKVDYENRYLVDHHVDGNSEELEILSDNKIVCSASSTCEILLKYFIQISLKEYNVIYKDMSINLFKGIVSDTAGFMRNNSAKLQKLISWLHLTEEEKQNIIYSICSLTEEQKYLMSNIIKIDDLSNNFELYYLNIDDMDKTKLLKNPEIEKRYACKDDESAVALIIQCNDEFHIKLKKGKSCDYDILDFALNNGLGGGHDDRCVARFRGYTFDDVIDELRNTLLSKGKRLVISYN